VFILGGFLVLIIQSKILKKVRNGLRILAACGKTQILSFGGVFFAEESLNFLEYEQREIPRFARNDKTNRAFRNLFSSYIYREKTSL